jgi:hypothetical protein
MLMRALCYLIFLSPRGSHRMIAGLAENAALVSDFGCLMPLVFPKAEDISGMHIFRTPCICYLIL